MKCVNWPTAESIDCSCFFFFFNESNVRCSFTNKVKFIDKNQMMMLMRGQNAIPIPISNFDFRTNAFQLLIISAQAFLMFQLESASLYKMQLHLLSQSVLVVVILWPNRTEQNGTGLILIAFNRSTFCFFYCRLLLVADDLKQFVYLLHVLCLIASHCLSLFRPTQQHDEMMAVLTRPDIINYESSAHNQRHFSLYTRF